MSKSLKIEITVDYKDIVTEHDRMEVDAKIEAVLGDLDLSTSETDLATDIPDPVRYSVDIVKEKK